MIKQIFAKVVTLFMLWFCVVPAWGLTLKVTRPGSDTPLSIELHATKRTEHALAVKMADGTIYYADMTRVGSSWPGGMFARLNNDVYLIGSPPTTPQFFVATTTGTDGFSFQISAKGYFVVDWVDGEVQQIVRTDTDAATYSHTYSTAGAYTIGIGGRATGYTTDNVAAISFKDNLNIAGIDGSLGAVFGTIGDGSGAGQQPRFYGTFSGCTNVIGAIPENLFAGIYGQPVDCMFNEVLHKCNFTGSIPANLFSGIKGHPMGWMFSHCLSFNPGLTGAIPDRLFAGVSGAPAPGAFAGIFEGDSGLTSIPENLFGNISGPLQHLTFSYAIKKCPGLTGQSAKINGKYLYEIWPDATTEQVGGCYYGTTGLSDYANIPAAWK